MFLDGPAHGARPVGGVVAVIPQQVARGLVQLEVEVALGQPLLDLGQFEIENLGEFLLAQGAEHDDVVEAVEEFRPENFLGFLGEVFLHPLVVLFVVGGGEAHGGTLLEPLGADVGGKQDDRVAEVHLPAEAVGQFALLENLEEHVHDVGMGLLDLVKQHDGVGVAAHLLGQLAAFLVADVARRRADEPRDVELLHVLGHVELHKRFAVAEHVHGETLGQECFADAGRAEHHESADRACGILEVGAAAAQRLAEGLDG